MTPFATAVLSPCGTYRYHLTRCWGHGALMPIIMLNPSTADAYLDDRTIGRCKAFADREGLSGISVCNLYAFRSRHPSDLLRAADPVGPDNATWLETLAGMAVANDTPVVCAWGGSMGATAATGHALSILRRVGAKTQCLGLNKDGTPKHPLFVGGNVPFEVFS